MSRGKTILAELPRLDKLRDREGQRQWMSMTRSQRLAVLHSELSRLQRGRHDAHKAVQQLELWKSRCRAVEYDLEAMIEGEQT